MRLLYNGAEMRLSTLWNTSAFPGVTFVDMEPITADCTLPDLTDTVLEIELNA